MDSVTCSLCGKKLDEEGLYMCINCGTLVCIGDYEKESGLCSNCSERGPDCQY